MVVHKIVIDGVTYGNVGSIGQSITPEYYHNVTALSGKKYQEVRYTKTDYTVQFFNLIDGVYTSLRAFINANKGEAVTCGFPDDNNGFIYADYFLTIQSEINKGYLNGKYFKNGLTVLFEAVNADE